MLTTASEPIISEQERTINKKLQDNLTKWVRENSFCADYQNVKSVADDLEVSVEQLNYFCKTELGVRFFTWRKELRMRYASFLLCLDEETPASNIGRLAGVDDSSDFRRQFKEIYKMSPEQWRKSED